MDVYPEKENIINFFEILHKNTRVESRTKPIESITEVLGSSSYESTMTDFIFLTLHKILVRTSIFY